MMGVSSGSVMRTKRRQAPAPSIAAASSSSPGIASSPMMYRIIAPPDCHRNISPSPGSAHCGENSQPGPMMPNSSRKRFSNPTSGLSTRANRIASATPGITTGMKMTVENRFWLVRMRLTSSASASATTTRAGSAVNTKLEVTRNDCQKSKSPNAREKLPSPRHFIAPMPFHSYSASTKAPSIGPARKIRNPINHGAVNT